MSKIDIAPVRLEYQYNRTVAENARETPTTLDELIARYGGYIPDWDPNLSGLIPEIQSSGHAVSPVAEFSVREKSAQPSSARKLVYPGVTGYAINRGQTAVDINLGWLRAMTDTFVGKLSTGEIQLSPTILLDPEYAAACVPTHQITSRPLQSGEPEEILLFVNPQTLLPYFAYPLPTAAKSYIQALINNGGIENSDVLDQTFYPGMAYRKLVSAKQAYYSTVLAPLKFQFFDITRQVQIAKTDNYRGVKFAVLDEKKILHARALRRSQSETAGHKTLPGGLTISYCPKGQHPLDPAALTLTDTNSGTCSSIFVHIRCHAVLVALFAGDKVTIADIVEKAQVSGTTQEIVEARSALRSIAGKEIIASNVGVLSWSTESAPQVVARSLPAQAVTKAPLPAAAPTRVEIKLAPTTPDLTVGDFHNALSKRNFRLARKLAADGHPTELLQYEVLKWLIVRCILQPEQYDIARELTLWTTRQTEELRQVLLSNIGKIEKQFTKILSTSGHLAQFPALSEDAILEHVTQVLATHAAAPESFWQPSVAAVSGALTLRLRGNSPEAIAKLLHQYIRTIRDTYPKVDSALSN